MSCQVCQKKTKTIKCHLCYTGAYCNEQCWDNHYKQHKSKCLKLRLSSDNIAFVHIKVPFNMHERNDFGAFDALPDVLCDMNTWFEYENHYDLYLLSKVFLRGTGLIEGFPDKINLVRELVRLGANSMIKYLESTFDKSKESKHNKCFSRDDIKCRVMEIGKEICELTYSNDPKYIDGIFDDDLLSFPKWAREELREMWKDIQML
jgi:hypothetical protein